MTTKQRICCGLREVGLVPVLRAESVEQAMELGGGDRGGRRDGARGDDDGAGGD